MVNLNLPLRYKQLLISMFHPFLVQVTVDNQVFNVFEDNSGDRQTVFVGSFDDLRTQEIKELGGIPVEQLERSFGKSFDGTITGFVDPAKKGEAIKLPRAVSSSHSFPYPLTSLLL